MFASGRVFSSAKTGLAVLCLAALSAALSAAHADTSKIADRVTHVITVANMQFSPQTLTVRRGDRIVWMNKDLFPHTATADSKVFDSQQIVSEGSWAYVVDAEPGHYAYSCTYHPTMKGKLVVRGAK